MKTELALAIIAGAIALISAAGTAWVSRINAERSDANSKAIAELKLDFDKRNIAEQRKKEISKFSEPLARSAYDLQGRLVNILKGDIVDAYLVKGNQRENFYIKNSTAYLIGQYLCWTELVRREIQFIDLGESAKTRELVRLQDAIIGLWASDQQSSTLRIFAGEQRAIGEALIQAGTPGPECVGYGAFLKTLGVGVDPLIDTLREDVELLRGYPKGAAERLIKLQNSLIELLEMLDPDYLRFPKEGRFKVRIEDVRWADGRL